MTFKILVVEHLYRLFLDISTHKFFGKNWFLYGLLREEEEVEEEEEKVKIFLHFFLRKKKLNIYK